VSMARQVFKGSFTLICTAALVACGGGGSGGATDGTSNGGGSSPTAQSVHGMLVAPLPISATSESVMERAASNSAGQRLRPLAYPGCPDVPDGYQPLASLAIQFLDSTDAVLSTLTTDNCGNFSGTVSADATVATARPATAAPITQPVSSLISVAGAPAPVLSTLPTGAQYVIGVVQDLGNSRIALTISDSQTGKAVLGLTPADFSFSVASAPVGLSSLSYGSSQAQGNASVSIVLDSSSSMSTPVGTTGRSRYQVAALAAHELLNGLRSGADEASVTLFSSSIYTMNDATLALQNWVDPSGATLPDYTFSATGRTQSIAALRPVIDSYNPDSQIYRSNGTGTGTDPVHPDTGNLRLSGSYRYSGVTAFYDGTIAGVNLLSSALNPRKIVVSMTDGQENASRARLADVVAAAQAQGIPVFTVAFGTATQVDEADMQAIADQTGGQYRRVEGIDLTGLFQGIQTGIRFQYVATLAAAPTSGTVMTISLTRGATPITRTLTIQ
jgi:hypothetical protein